MSSTNYSMGAIAHRPWGMWQVLDIQPGFLVKKIIVKAGERLSLQRHQFRAEQWVIVSGIATFELNGVVSILQRNDTAEIPLGAWHRITNAHSEDVYLIEIQMGEQLSEDDIERAEDDYGRR